MSNIEKPFQKSKNYSDSDAPSGGGQLMRVVFGGFVGGLALFTWGAVSWMVLPFHRVNLNAFTQENVVDVVLASNAPNSGIYILPNPHAQQNAAASFKTAGGIHERMARGPFAFVSVKKQGTGSMKRQMAIAAAINILAALIVAGFVAAAGFKKYAERVSVAVIFAIAAGVICQLPYWNWWGFSGRFILLEFSDLVIGWFLAGLVIAAAVTNE